MYSCVNVLRQLTSIVINWRQLTFIEVMLTFVNMTSCVIFHHGWRQLTWRVRHDVFWRPWRFLMFFDVYWRFLKFQKISKNFWRKLTKIDASVNLKPRQLTSIDINWRQLSSAKVIWRQLTTIDVKWLQTWCFLTPFDVFWCILTIFDNKNLSYFPNYFYLIYLFKL